MPDNVIVRNTSYSITCGYFKVISETPTRFCVEPIIRNSYTASRYVKGKTYVEKTDVIATDVSRITAEQFIILSEEQGRARRSQESQHQRERSDLRAAQEKAVGDFFNSPLA